jgi:hypothetical protein
MEANEEGVSELVAAAGEDICEFVADECPDGFLFRGKRVVPKDLTKSPAELLAERAARAIRRAILHSSDPRVTFPPTSLKGRPSRPSDEGIKKLVKVIERDLVAAYQDGFMFEGKQDIPDDERNDVARELARQVAGVISKTIRKNEKITFLARRTLR